MAELNTLGSLMTELKARLGFVTQGAASHNNDTIMRSFLQEAHDFVYEELDHPLTKRVAHIKLSKGSKLYDFHDDELDEDINPGDIDKFWIGDGKERYSLRFGINEAVRNSELSEGRPERWDAYAGQLELWPAPDSDKYELVLEYFSGKRRFSRDTDTPSVPARLVFLYALATAKAHYRHPDSQAAARSFDQMLKAERGKRVFKTNYKKKYTTARGWFVERLENGEDRVRYFGDD